MMKVTFVNTTIKWWWWWGGGGGMSQIMGGRSTKSEVVGNRKPEPMCN